MSDSNNKPILYTDENNVVYEFQLGPLASETVSIYGLPVAPSSFIPEGIVMALRPYLPHPLIPYPPIVILGQRIDDVIAFIDPYKADDAKGDIRAWLGYYIPIVQDTPSVVHDPYNIILPFD